MTFLERLQSVFAKKGFVDKAKSNSMTAADWLAVRAAYKEEYGVELSADQATYNNEQQQAQRTQQLEQENDAALTLINAAMADSATGNGADTGAVETSDANHVESQNQNLLQGVQSMVNAFQTMSRGMIPDNAVQVSGATLSPNGPGNTNQYLCGIEHPMFSMSLRYNKIATDPSLVSRVPVSEANDGDQFRKDLGQYSHTLAERINTLRSRNALNPKAIREDFALNVTTTGLGDQYLIRRTDELIVRLLSIKNVFDIFPRRYGIQDREVMFNAFMGEFSQAYQKGEIWKGNIDLKPEYAYVDDAMFKTLFDSMKDLERKYVGYLNKDGSDPIKWTMIEWAMLQISTKLIEEQNKRKILGIHVKPETGKTGSFLNAGTGVYYTLLRYYNEYKIALVDESAYASYNSGTTMVACVVNMLLKLASTVDNLDEYEVILNANHRAMWLSGIRDTYGKDMDFRGPNGDEVPDLRNVIRWCPYEGQLPLIIVQQPGNIQSLEFIAGEMFRMQFLPDMESVKAWAVWKEGTSAEFSGKPAASKAAKKTAGFAEQVIFMNRPAVTIAADATTVTATGDYRHYITGVNTAAKAITDITGAKAGVAYMIEVGDVTYPQSIAKSGKFANLTAAYTPTTAGDYIMVILNADGDKFIELERCVAGVRTINQTSQPNVPGGR